MCDWPEFEKLPGKDHDPASFSWSPRMSYLGTAVVMSPEHYERSRQALAKMALFDEMFAWMKRHEPSIRTVDCGQCQWCREAQEYRDIMAKANKLISGSK